MNAFLYQTLQVSHRGRKPQVCRRNCNTVFAVWVATLLFPGVRQCRIYLWTLPLSLVWSKTLFTALELQ